MGFDQLGGAPVRLFGREYIRAKAVGRWGSARGRCVGIDSSVRFASKFESSEVSFVEFGEVGLISSLLGQPPRVHASLGDSNDLQIWLQLSPAFAHLWNGRRMKSRNAIVLSAGLIVVGAVALLAWFYKTQTVWVESRDYQRSSKEAAKTLVVVYSRTGNTLSAAKEAARLLDADLIAIDAPQYSRDLKGQQLASKHADEEVTRTTIVHDPVDMEQYELIVLCSPTWWYRPAIPLWSFVESHDFRGRRVLLLMTGNSRMTDERTGKFRVLVEEKNGELVDVLFIRRGRVFWQKRPDQVNQEVLEALRERKDVWPRKVR